MKRLTAVLSVAAALSMLVSACAPAPSARVAQSSLSRNTAPDVPSDDVTALIRDNNSFALDLYRSLHSEDGNLAFSPYSLSIALAMTYAGARGQTASEMAQTLHYTLPQERLHPAFNRLDLDLTAEAQGSDRAQNPLQLKIANAVWGEQTFSFLQDYLDLIARNYGAGVQLADFVNHYEQVRQQINDWVSRQTAGKIVNLIPEGALDTLTKMVLVNAIYFKADWLDQFDPNDTVDAPFHLLDGTQAQSRMMFNEISGLPYASGEGWQAVELAYQGNTAAMDIIVPDEGRFEQIESELDTQKLEQILGSMQPMTVKLGLPKFTFRSSFDLGDQLSGMGMPDAFNPDRADFSGMSGGRDLYISKVLHQTFVAVDEKGTEAAAATAVIMAPTAIMLPDKVLTIDHPFIFLIRDLKSGQVLFLGRVLNPGK